MEQTLSMSRKTETTFLLNRAGVDHVADALSAFMQTTGMKRPDMIRMRFAMETLLLNVCEHFEEQAEVTVITGSRLGTPYFRFRYAGEAFDPRAKEPENAGGAAEFSTDDIWTKQLLANLGAEPTWRYRHGINEIALRAPRAHMRVEMLLAFSVVAAVVLGAAGAYLPEGVRGALGTYLLSPLSALFMNLLSTFAGVLVFLSVLCGVSGIGTAADFSKKGKYVILHFLRETAMGALLMGAVAIPFYHFGSGGGGGESQFGALFDMVLAFIPTNPVTPFEEGNMMQIVFMAILLGVVILALGERTEGLRDILTQCNTAVMQVVEIICQLLPIYIFASLTLVMWENGLGIFFELWKPLVLCAVVMAAAVVVKAVLTGMQVKVSPGKLLRKIRPAAVIALTTGSSMASFGTVLETNEKSLGIDAPLSRFAVPIGNLLNCGPTGFALMLITMHLASFYGISAGIGWFFTLWLMCSILAIALPPVSGGMLICLGLLLSQFSIPAAALGVAGTLAILTEFFETGSRVAIQQLELVRMAHHFRTIDREILER